MDSVWWSWVLLPLLIFFARIVAQTVGTLRLLFASKGFKCSSSIFGFLEVILWLLAIAQIMKHLYNPLCYIAYGAGFSMGNYIGILVEEKLSIGNLLVRIVPQKNSDELVRSLSDHRFGVTTVDGMGIKGPVKIIFTIIRREDISRVISLINCHNPHAFYAVEEIKSVKEGYFGLQPENQSSFSRFFHPFS